MVKASLKPISNNHLFTIRTEIINWVKKHRFEATCLVLVLLVGAFMRLFKIDQYMTFLGDEGRDALIVRRLLVNFDIILVGPGTSIGNMYLGPLYYYLMAPFLFIANYSPVGPAVMIALLGVATLFLIWWVVREWFPTKGMNVGALVAASLYAVAPTVIIYSRSSWNPNIMPFFSLLFIYSIWRLWKFNDLKWLIVSGISFAFVLQSHYLGLLLLPVFVIYWIFSLLKIINLKMDKNYQLTIKEFILFSLTGFIAFAALMSPLIIFDARHSWRNFEALKTFFTVRQETVSVKPWNSVPKMYPMIEKITTRLLTGTDQRIGNLTTLLLLCFSLSLLVSFIYNIFLKNKFKHHSLLTARHSLLFLWLGFALVGLGLYKQEIYDHYYGFFFTAPFILIGGFIQDMLTFYKKQTFIIHLLAYILILTSYFILLTTNLSHNPLKYPPNRQLQRSIDVSQKIILDSHGREFNIAVIAERNYEGAYQYFLEAWNAPFKIIDAQKPKETITDQLFVVCELPEEKCDPTHNPKTEIANFGWTTIDSKENVDGVTIYKLVHSI